MLLALSAICGVELASPLLVTTHANSVLELRLNRPSKLNSLTGELVDLLAELRGIEGTFAILLAVHKFIEHIRLEILIADGAFGPPIDRAVIVTHGQKPVAQAGQGGCNGAGR